MNYLRGAVNAISAPYQYYKDLPPINPSTLTGAIDVIVVQRPTDSGGTELACTPFHVRFGKWQVLRPGEKKVDVSINGHRIPFNMKIGEAGEAFFVFETEDDVPDSLTTSPILQATAEEQPRQEPDFLDLNAPPPKQHHKTLSMPSAPSREDQSVETELDKRADQALSQVANSVEPPQVDYTDGLAIDVEGYHQGHARERSDRTIKSSKMYTFPARPSTEEADEDDEDNAEPTLPLIRATSEPPPDLEAGADQDPPQLSTSTSQPGLTNLSVQEYSWDWGAFPQPSPMKVSFSKGGRIEPPISPANNTGSAMTWGKSVSKGKERMKYNAIDQVDEKETTEGSGRSRSVPPPDLLANPQRRRHKSLYAAYPEDSWIEETPLLSARATEGEYGLGGRLSVSKSDPSLFRVSLDGKKAEFELSLVFSDMDDEDDQDNRRGRRGRDGSFGGVTLFSEMSGVDDFELSRRFDKGKVTFDRFLDDETVISDPRLVIRWAGSQYLTRHDESPLMRALVIWRDDYLREKAEGKIPSRPSSPVSDDDDAVKESAPPQEPSSEQTSTSSSWVQWWKRSRRTKNDGRPELKGAASSPAGDVVTSAVSKPKPIHPADSAPALPSTPIQQPVRETTSLSTSISAPQTQHKYIKTLRLTSDQLKSLNLKPGANTMTFALSSTGTIACAARIFVWDSADRVVVSDIDGTITKSDGLGHVFAMIGRDWTHLGVAKLYTDITRNGYKIMYLTSRAIGQADATRGYLRGIKQNDYQLPEGPVIMSPDRLMASLHREVIMRKPEVFKMACLRDILRVFGEGKRNPFYAGFGNRITDALSYRSVNVPSSRIFTIDTTGEVKLELLELAGYKSSYIHMTDLVDQMFPPIHRKWTPEYTDFNYWKTPVPEYPLPDLSPPSPTLSARSDTSNQQSTLARLRNFSLVGGRQANVPKAVTSPERSSDLQKMSSFERLSNTLGFAGSGTSTPRRSLSPASASSSTFADSEDEEEFDYDAEGKRRRRQRTRSMTSMPGSLEDMPLDDEPDHGDIADLEDGVVDDDEVAEEAFDEDLLATGEMQNVPFL